MTEDEAQSIVDVYTKMWPFSRLTPEEMKKLEEAYSVLIKKARKDVLKDVGDAPL